MKPLQASVFLYSYIKMCAYCLCTFAHTFHRELQKGTYDRPVLLLHPEHSAALSDAKPLNRSLIKSYITAQQMLTVTVFFFFFNRALLLL